jgi:hypothetical protein
VTFQPTATDYIAANKDWFRISLRSPRASRRRLQLLALTLGLGGVVGYLETGNLRQAALSAVLCAAAAATFLGLVCLGVYLLIPRRAGRLYRQQKTFEQPFHYSWTDEGITLRTSTSEGRYAWPQIYGWANGRTALLLFFNEQLFYFLPHRVLGPEASADLAAKAERGGVERL